MSTNQSVTAMQTSVKDALRVHWKSFLIQGVAILVLGCLAVTEPVLATAAVDIYIGWLLLISGIVGLIAMFLAQDVPAFLWTSLTAALSVAVGLLLIWKPAEGAVSLTIVLTAFFVADGIFQIAASFAYRDSQLLGLDAREWYLRPDPCSHHRLQLANQRRLDTWIARWDQLYHFRPCRNHYCDRGASFCAVVSGCNILRPLHGRERHEFSLPRLHVHAAMHFGPIPAVTAANRPIVYQKARSLI